MSEDKSVKYTIQDHIEKSYQRLNESDYQIQNIWQPGAYDWPGDWEGRALLAFTCLYEITGKKIECMDKMIELLPEHLNELGYFGKICEDGKMDEQQLSSHSWVLRGLCEYYKVFKDEKVLNMAKDVANNLFIKGKHLYENYPTSRIQKDEGDVSGNLTGEIDGWLLSSDVGCAYMCIDGLAEYYCITDDENVKEMLDDLIERFLYTDRIKMKCQTHATLSATRGIIKLYDKTGDKYYLENAVKIYEFYEKYGMTKTFENFNWFDRFDTWTEPCCIVDSFIVSSELYRITKEEKYKKSLRRIWFNALSFCHRANGGAGPNKCTTNEQRTLKIHKYEAPYCCTMRYCEGLVFVKKNEDLLSFDKSKEIVTDEFGRRFVDDVMIVKSKDGKDHFLCDLAFPENDSEIEYRI